MLGDHDAPSKVAATESTVDAFRNSLSSVQKLPPSVRGHRGPPVDHPGCAIKKDKTCIRTEEHVLQADERPP